MILKGMIDLPANLAPGGFDHAAYHSASRRMYVAHTCNNCVDVIDTTEDRFLYSIPDLPGVAGALVSEERGLVFTSNRGDDTVGIFAVEDEKHISKVRVGIKPNGLSFDPKRGLLLAANVGDPDLPGSHTLSVVDIAGHTLTHSIPVSGRTKWTVFDPGRDCFYINIPDPPQIVVVNASNPTSIHRSMEIPAAGPHGLDLDPVTDRLFCACDSGKLIVLEALTGKILSIQDLSGKPDVIFYNQNKKHLYVAIGKPGLIEVFDTELLKRIETIPTEEGAHTIGFAGKQNKVYAFLPASHRAFFYQD